MATGGTSASSTAALLDILDPDLKITVLQCLLDDKSLKVNGTIGEGNFGIVYEGRVDNKHNIDTRVAIKTIKGNKPTKRETSEFLEEATIMKDFEHKNVLSLVGVVIKENIPYVCLPFMSHGDLKKYVADPINTFSYDKMLSFGHQIASGMTYLASRKFVHRDLAARNCMIDEDEVIKVADFGLARDIYRKDYYRVKTNRPLPMRWMAPESISRDNRIFSSESDVWSFGVVLWELITGCTARPYESVENWDILTYLSNGHRLYKPSQCTQNVYEIMLKCWQATPRDRPSFYEIERELSRVLGFGDI